ncbi:DDE family endonuclease [Mycena kentingensis (nom. inval.)]|nr:DDE family endonuclease [Mycena kentingensis (nom. inval.)]
MPKGKSISVDLRWAIVRMSPVLDMRTISAFTNVSKRQIYRILDRFRRTGDVSKDGRSRAGRTRHLTTMEVAFLHGCLDLNCDRYLDELQHDLEERCQRVVSLSTIWRALKRSGYTMMKLTRTAIERNALKRARFKLHTSLTYLPYQLVFVDESSCDRRTTYRGKAWAIKGSRAVRKAFFIRGQRWSDLPAISLDGILWVSIVEGSFTTEKFEDFIGALLDKMNPFPGPNSVIVMDNCRIHKADSIRDMIEARGMRCEFLPPYSPDFNPMEPGFSKMKAYIRRHGDRVRTAMLSEEQEVETIAALYDAVYSITPEDAAGWFRLSGYF